MKNIDFAYTTPNSPKENTKQKAGVRKGSVLKTQKRVSLVVEQKQETDPNMLIDEGSATKYLSMKDIDDELNSLPGRRQVYKAVSQNSIAGFNHEGAEQMYDSTGIEEFAKSIKLMQATLIGETKQLDDVSESARSEQKDVILV